VSTWFDDGKVTLFKDNLPCIDGLLHNDMWRLNFELIELANEEDESIAMMATLGGPDFCTA
jgi:hypothetical protein